MPLDPQVLTLLETAKRAGTPPLHILSLEAQRDAAEAVGKLGGALAPLKAVTDLTIPGPGSELPLRIYTPYGAGPFPVLLYIHGGGWVIGSIESYDLFCRRIAAEANCIVASLGYRLAPEHPFPAAVDDSYAAAVWIAEHAASFNGDATRLAIGGDSAGGNLATVATLLAKERQSPQYCAQVLLQPITDYYQPGTSSYQEFAEGYFLTRDDMASFWQRYLPDEALAQSPYTSPLRAKNLAGLPPALIITAEFDPLRDEGEHYAKRLQDAGVPVYLRRFEGMIHPFLFMSAVIDQANPAIAFIAEHLRITFQPAISPSSKERITLQNSKVQRILHSKTFAHLATLGSHGEPQSSPMWFLWDGEYLKFTHATNRKKYQNIKCDPRVSISIMDRDEPYTYAEFRGVVERIEEDPDAAFFNTVAEHYGTPWRNPGDPRVVLFVKIEHIAGQNL